MKSLLAQLPPAPPGRTGWPWTEETPAARYSAGADWPRISIVTPSYQQAGFLEETLRSVLLQNYPNLQYIVVDGGSTDGSRDIIARYAPWLDHWESERDRGQSHAINKGLARCDGRWFNWINSDDCLLPGALASVARADRPNALLISGAEITGAAIAESRPLGRTKTGPTMEEALVDHYICQQGLFFRTDTAQALGGVREDLHYVMDLDLFARFLLRGGLASIVETADTLAFFRRHGNAKTDTAAGSFFAEERRLFSALAAAAAVDPAVRRHLGEPGVPSFGADAAALDRPRFAARLAQKYWWDGTVETAWRNRSLGEFRREVREFLRAFPELRSRRTSKLHFLSRLPDAVLRLLSGIRRAPSP